MRKWNGNLENGSSFCSIGGAGKQNVIERILEAGYDKVVIAVDKDSAGDGCRTSNADLPSLISRNKDWNEDLIAMKKGRLDLSP